MTRELSIWLKVHWTLNLMRVEEKIAREKRTWSTDVIVNESETSRTLGQHVDRLDPGLLPLYT